MSRACCSAVLLAFLVLSAGLTSCLQSSSSADEKARLRDRGAKLYADGEYDKAASKYLALLRVDPSDADAYYHLGLIRAKQAGPGNWQKGVAELTKVIELDPTHRGARIRLAELYLAANQSSQAKKQVNVVLKHAARDPDGLLLLGRISAQEQDMRRAIAAYRQTLDANPAMPQGRHSLAD